ncbi:hydantoinase/oxoprolinase family protein [Paradesulfitobacterium ferrireducens]|uniref:hydantoinase/oxoprolinase family protein n=1 Tax=Paradesulfitobacterium ferrireducens TaxID=2816476 RepID=UPI001A90746E|nr:hydantoinase/oxoprolinase family protein [Paradesulfitobacterium ferrireducens]
MIEQEESKKEYYIYVDTGGTFTDCVVVRSDGHFISGKSATTPEDLEKGFLNSISATLVKEGLSLEEVIPNTKAIGYGTTQGTNIIVSGAGGPKLGLITTKGHEDRTIIMRLRAAGLNSIDGMHMVKADKPNPIIPRTRIRGVAERVDCMGKVITSLDEEELRSVITELVEEEKVKGIAVGFIWSFLNNAHEQRAKEIINEMYPGLAVAISSEVEPIIREYPRFMSTEIDLYIGQALKKLLDNIHHSLEEHGYKSPLLVLQAAGGVARSEVVKPATTLHSGPVGGLAGVEFYKGMYGIRKGIGTDMGGTSFDITISTERGSEYLREPIVGRFQISNPMLEIITAGAGGGTIAFVDKITRTLHVGPQSAGAVPGPVCYDQGGLEPTVTDADVVLNRIDADYFLGGKLKLNRKKALEAIEEKIAKPLNLDVYKAASGICKIIDSAMAGALNAALAARGIDPTSYTLLSFGGAGPAHCAGYTNNMPFARIIIPRSAPVFSAFGASTADIRHRYEGSPFLFVQDLPFNPTTLQFDLDKITLAAIPTWALDRYNSIVSKIKQYAEDDMVREGYASFETHYEILARYGGQLWEIRLDVPVATINTDADFKLILDRFEQEYMKVYTRQAMVPRGGIEIVNVAVEAVGKTPKVQIAKYDFAGKDPSGALKGQREVYFDNWLVTSVYEWNKLGNGNEILGPAIIEAEEATVVLTPGRKIVVDEFHNLNMSSLS